MTSAPDPVEQAILDDVIQYPGDHSLWHILSDWLDEREDPRAELIRLTHSLRTEPDHPDFLNRQARVQSLIAQGMQPVVPRKTVHDFEFAWIPPGTFLMGSPVDEPKRESNEDHHRVTLTRGFFLGTTPVTQAQWKQVMGANPSHFKGDEHPVDQVSWRDCQEFCVQLETDTGLGFRLPTEAEWEYACRAGTTTPFSFGPTITPDQANYDGNHIYPGGHPGMYHMETVPVRSYPPNAWGLYEMHGNAYDWCEDWYAPYPGGTQTDPIGPPAGDARILRGGCWFIYPHICRSAYRRRSIPGDRQYYFSCRVVYCPE
jgi:uncharacterized protein (TIGR02996 family)